MTRVLQEMSALKKNIKRFVYAIWKYKFYGNCVRKPDARQQQKHADDTKHYEKGCDLVKDQKIASKLAPTR